MSNSPAHKGGLDTRVPPCQSYTYSYPDDYKRHLTIRKHTVGRSRHHPADEMAIIREQRGQNYQDVIHCLDDW